MTTLFSKFSIELVKEKGFSYSGQAIDSPETLIEEFNKIFRLENQAEEIVAMIALGTDGNIVGAFEVSRGSLNASILHPREVFKRAFAVNANKIVLAHNHPSGNASPSDQDADITARLKEAGEILGVELLDHIIIGGEEFTSCRRLGII